MRVLIVDDETAARRRLSLLLEGLDVEVVGEAKNGVEAIALVRERRPDVVLLDIAMPEVDGFDVVRHLDEPRPLIIFQTAHDDHALEAFEHEALDYVVKPVVPVRLQQALERAERRLQEAGQTSRDEELLAALRKLPAASTRKPRLLVKDDRGHRLLALSDVARFSAEQGAVYAHTDGERHVTDLTLSEIEARTTGDFVRTSRSALVNLDAVERLRVDADGVVTLVLRDGTDVRVSRRRATEVRSLLTR